MKNEMQGTPKLTEGVMDRRIRYPEFFCGGGSGIFSRPNYLISKGQVHPGHTHNFDHVTFIMKGSVHVKAIAQDGSVMEKAFAAPNSELEKFEEGVIHPMWFLVKAETMHEITALEDDTIFICVYSHRDSQGRVTVESTGWESGNSLAYI